MGLIWTDEDKILSLLEQVLKNQTQSLLNEQAILKAISNLQNSTTACCQQTQSKLDQLINTLIAPAVGLKVSVTAYNSKGEIDMAATTTAVDVQIQDNGSALYTFTAVDSEGQATAFPAGTPALSNIVVTDPYVTANPGASPLWNVVVNPNDTTGMSLIGTAVNPLPAGVTLPDTGVGVSAQTTFPGATSPVTGTAPLIDIVAGAAAGLAVAVVSQTQQAKQ